MYSHIIVGARDLKLMAAFYESILSHLGLVRMPDDLDDQEPPGVGWQHPERRWPQFFVQRPINELPATWGNGTQVSFAASSHEQVVKAWETAIALGGKDEGPPGFRPQYSDDYFGAYCRDPEGNKLCFVHADGLGDSKR
ncbi:VOC family protein [Pseudomonas syringae]|nr:VOC family protein [Pseudomonas syringae]MCF5069282.1 VOC family protein [Pseudomonas syringae]